MAFPRTEKEPLLAGENSGELCSTSRVDKVRNTSRSMPSGTSSKANRFSVGHPKMGLGPRSSRPMANGCSRAVTSKESTSFGTWPQVKKSSCFRSQRDGRDGNILSCSAPMGNKLFPKVGTAKRAIWLSGIGPPAKSFRNSLVKGREGSQAQALTRSAAYSLDGKRLVSGGDDMMLRCWDIASGKEIWVSDIEEKPSHPTPSLVIAFSPDGSRAFTAIGGWIENGEHSLRLRVWDTADGSLLRRLPPLPGGKVR